MSTILLHYGKCSRSIYVGIKGPSAQYLCYGSRVIRTNDLKSIKNITQCVTPALALDLIQGIQGIRSPDGIGTSLDSGSGAEFEESRQ